MMGGLTCTSALACRRIMRPAAGEMGMGRGGRSSWTLDRVRDGFYDLADGDGSVEEGGEAGAERLPSGQAVGAGEDDGLGAGCGVEQRGDIFGCGVFVAAG